MKIYKVLDIKEQDFGCEERPSGMEYCVDVILEDNETSEKRVISAPDNYLYKNNIDVGSLVNYYDQKLNLYKNKETII